jgi:hypothetical protein
MRLMLLNGLLLGLIAVAVVGGQLASRTDAAVETSVRRYAQAVRDMDLEAAMAEIAPDQRARYTDWVRSQLGNVYDVRGIAVRAPSLLQAPRNRAPVEVTVGMDVNRGFPEEFYQPTARVPVTVAGGRAYLAIPLLADAP